MVKQNPNVLFMKSQGSLIQFDTKPEILLMVGIAY